MFTLIFLGALITGVVGIVLKVVLDKKQAEQRITNKEFGVSMVLMLVVVIPLTAWIGIKVAINNQVTFNENWNGWETKAELVRVATREDGSMRHYWIETRTEYYWDDEEYTDSNGKKQTRRVRKSKQVDYKIPYTTEEWDFVVHTTIGDVVIATGFLPENPNNYRYRMFTAVPEWKYESTTGYHPYYLTVKDRIQRNEPGPVTLRKNYENYILASQRTILQRYSDSIDTYKKDGMFPQLMTATSGYYDADRVYVVGNVKATGDWRRASRRFNAAFGQTLQGDLHLVIVEAEKVGDRDNYGGALLAYWQSSAFGKNALSKNGVVVILGANKEGKVEWANAYTGMPMGNEKLLLEIRNTLPGTPLDAQAILGDAYATLNGGAVTVHNTQGALEKLMWGTNTFQRVHMTDKHGGVGYEYLLRELEPTTGQQVGILFVVLIFAGAAWGFCIYAGPQTYREILFRLGIRKDRFR